MKMNRNIFNIIYAIIMLSLAILLIILLDVNGLGDGFASFIIGFTSSIIYWATRDNSYHYITNLNRIDENEN